MISKVCSSDPTSLIFFSVLLCLTFNSKEWTVRNNSLFKKIQKIFQKDKNDWWDDLPNSAKEGIKEGIVDIKNGRIHSYEEVKKEFGWK